MRIRHRRLLAATAAVALASALAVVEAPAGFAAEEAVLAVRDVQPRPSPVVIAFSGLPGTVRAGGAPVEFSVTLRNTADHPLSVPSSVFTVGDTGTGTRQSQFRLEYQSPGATRWQDARVDAADARARWTFDQPAVLSLAAGAEAGYRLRLTVTADAPAGRVAPGFDSVVSDPALPPEQRTTSASSGHPDLVIAPAVAPTSPPTTPPATPAATVEAGFDSVPVSFTAGAEAKPFRLVLTNRSGRPLRVLPAVVFQGESELPSDVVGLEFRAADGQWRGATRVGSQEHPTWLYCTLRTGDRNADTVTLANGESYTIELRLAFTKDAPPRAESLTALAGTLPGEGESAAEAVGQEADFIIVAAATAPPAPTSSATGRAPVATEPSTAPVVPAAAAATP
ncbi:hypothetical protein, partial [Streptomyces sp. CBMA156]|uniref:hypothetical protein n=1 Tax=Streptomyces sp. CBMA156 TaxID=1930280 RepID=UPI001E0E7851|nr:hypothetical protein [Streptomyces sp. CBMA156]